MGKRRYDYHPTKGSAEHQIVTALEPLTRHGWGSDTIFRDWVFTADALASLLRGHALNPEQRDHWLRFGSRYRAETKSARESDAYTACGAALAALVAALEADPSHDVLGPLHMNWGNPNEQVGQFFTPMGVSMLMAQITLSDWPQMVASRFQAGLDACPAGAAAFAEMGLDLAQIATWSDDQANSFVRSVLPQIAPWIEPIRSLEPCCGAGAMILAQIAVLPRWIVRVGLFQFVAIDLDPLCVAMTHLQATILGANITCIRADALAWDGTLPDGSANPLAGTIPDALRRLYGLAAQARADGDQVMIDKVISVINLGRAGNEEPGRTLLAEQESLVGAEAV